MIERRATTERTRLSMDAMTERGATTERHATSTAAMTEWGATTERRATFDGCDDRKGRDFREARVDRKGATMGSTFERRATTERTAMTLRAATFERHAMTERA